MDTGPPPPYPQAVYAGEQPTGPPLQNGAYPYQQAGIQPGTNGVSFGQVSPPVTTQPVVTPQGVLVEEHAAAPGAAAAAHMHGKKKRHRHGGRGGWCCFYCGPCPDCDCCDCGDCDCCDCGDCGDCGDCDCGGCDCGDCLSVLCCCLES
ncbi:uncharacterized protein LOC144862498 isoform X1 [Branchiostoma floridae x Branchiostoma japonicum]